MSLIMLAGLGLIVEEEDDTHPTQVASSSWWRVPALQLEDTRGPSVTEGIILFGGGLDAIMVREPIPVVPPPVEPELSDLPRVDDSGGGPQAVSEGPTEEQFFAGWYDAGGQSLKSDAAAWRLVNCESTWNIYAGYYHLGLLQFSRGTWDNAAANTGLADPYNPYHQGFNGAWHAQFGTVNPGGTGGWPYCWWT